MDAGRGTDNVGRGRYFAIPGGPRPSSSSKDKVFGLGVILEKSRMPHCPRLCNVTVDTLSISAYYAKNPPFIDVTALPHLPECSMTPRVQ